jgi:Papain-like cysteine protease AvrRpt2
VVQTLPLNMQPQQQTEWCWAAVAVSVSLFYNSGSSWIQCSVVNSELNQSSCCQNGPSAVCNQPWYLDSALQRTGNLDHWVQGSASFSQSSLEVKQGKPLGVRIGWLGGGGHFIAISGYDDSNAAAPLAYVCDPNPGVGPSWVSYNTLVNSYQGSGQWTTCYYTRP